MGTRVSYPVEVKMKAIEIRLAGVPVIEVMEDLNIRNGELHRLQQPVGKQYAFGKGPGYENETDRLRVENRFLKQQIEVIKK